MSQDPSVEASNQDCRSSMRTVRRLLLACALLVVALIVVWRHIPPQTPPRETLQLQIGENVSFRFLRLVSSEGKGQWESKPLDAESGRAIIHLVQGANHWQPKVEAAWSIAWDWPPIRRQVLAVQFSPPNAQLEVWDANSAVPVLRLDLFGTSFVGTDTERYEVQKENQRELAQLLTSLEKGDR